MSTVLDHYRAEFAAQKTNDPAKLAALEKFCAQGFPSLKIEEWRYTNVAPIAAVRFARASAARLDLQHPALQRFAALSPVLIVNGVLGSKHAAVHVQASTDLDTPAFVSLNKAFAPEVIDVHLQGNTAEPIFLLFVSTQEQAMCHPRLRLKAARGSRSRVVEIHTSLAAGFTNVVVEVELEENAKLEHTRLQCNSALHIANVAVQQKRGSTYISNAVTVGGTLVRNDINVKLQEPEASCVLNGIYAVATQDHVDCHTCVEHVAQHTHSREFYKGVVAGRAVFNGRVLVQAEAQKTDAAQSNKNLLLAKNATVNTKPELEIYADDVKCAHGATVGQLDPQAIFYMRSRGIGLEEARRQLTLAFANDVIEKISAGRQIVGDVVNDWLQREVVS